MHCQMHPPSRLIRYEQQMQRAHHDMGREKAAIRQRFYTECFLLSKLRHPNIVQFMGVARIPNTGEMALIMEALFSDLGNLVEQHKEISDPIKISLMLDVANGLLYLHSQNPPVIHRDLSAANVLVTVDLRGKIADLGVAKLLDHGYIYSGQQTAQPGAYAYMAPEALKETPVYDTKLDIFSFGAVLLYTINNEFPKVHEVELSYDDFKEGRIQIAKRKRAVSLANGHCLLPLTLRCLHDKPERRPNTNEVRDSINYTYTRNKRRKMIEIDQSLRNDDLLTIATLNKQKDEMKERITTLEQHNIELNGVLEDYRSQNKRLIHDNQQKYQELATLRQALAQRRSPQQPSRGDLQELNEVKAQLEKNDLLQNLEQVNTQWEDRVRRLECHLQAYQKGDKHTKINTEASLRDANKTIAELKRQVATLKPMILSQMPDSEDTVLCPQCQTQVPAAGGGDVLQLHYITSCSGYDKVSNQSLQPEAAAKTVQSSSAISDLSNVQDGLSDSEDTFVCPLCQTRVPAAGGGDAIQLHYLTSCSGYDKVSNQSPQPEAAAKTVQSSSAISDLSNVQEGLSDSEDTFVCPLCQTRVPAAGGGDAIQLHYLTSCSGYDKVSRAAAKTVQSSSAISDLSNVDLSERQPKVAAKKGCSSSASSISLSNAATIVAPLYFTASTTASVSHSVRESAGASSSSGGPSEDETTSSVQFMWQPLSDVHYPTITLLASFKGGSADLKINPDGGHYVSEFISIPKGTYEGQLVIGDSFMHPVDNFTIKKDNDIIELKFTTATQTYT